MTTRIADGSVNCVAIFDAIPAGELNTAKRLKEDLRDLVYSLNIAPIIRYFRCESKIQLHDHFGSLLEEVRNEGLRPCIHLEAHGLESETGFVVADGEPVSWSDLKDFITPINVACNLNTLITLAACFGGSFASAINTVDRAPVLGLIGPTREMTAHRAEVDFPAFYTTFFSEESMKKAVEALNRNAERDLYYATTAKRFFYAAWANYKKNFCSAEKIEQRVREIRRNLKKKGNVPIPSVGNLKRRLTNTEAEKAFFMKYATTYFMSDLYPDNSIRFPVTYEEVESYVNTR